MGRTASKTVRLLLLAAVLAAALLALSCSETPLDAQRVGFNPVQRIPTVALTTEEKAYLADLAPLRAGVVDGAAPLLYLSSRGQVQGIGVRILNEVAARTGFVVEYHVYSDQRALLADPSVDVFPIIDPNYAPDGMVLSDPYLFTETVLFINKNISAEKLDDKRFAFVEGGALPSGINEALVRYYPNREYAIDAVERGEADYGYGNAYSIAYLSLKKGYRNLVTVPQGMGVRRYSIGLFKDDALMMSIVNKGLASITDAQMQALILDEASRIEQVVTVSMVMEQYGPIILLISFAVIVVLIYLAVANVRTAVLLKRQNRRYEALFDISHEYLFEYERQSRGISFAPETRKLLGPTRRQNQAMQTLATSLEESDGATVSKVVDLKIHDGSSRTFRLNAVEVAASMKRRSSYIGKLSDISDEERQLADLRIRVVTDGLTGLLNQVAIREEIETLLSKRTAESLDVLVLMDCDQFKYVNDTYGHLAGDRFLKILGECLVSIFGEERTIGRVGGDEFCVYIQAAGSLAEVTALCDAINPTFQKRIKAPFSVSVGVAVVEDGDGYDDLFRRTDTALYQVKRNGGAATLLYEK